MNTLKLTGPFRRVAKSILPPLMIEAMRNVGRRARRVARPATWDKLRTMEPLCRDYGYRRGKAVDRFYIEKFLDAHRQDVQGRVLEIANRRYTNQFGADRVTQSDVLHAVEGNPEATIVGNLVTGEGIPAGVFDCFIMTETLSVIYDVRAAMRTAYAALKPGGCLLMTVSGMSQIARYDMERWGDYWRFTSRSAQCLIEEVCPDSEFEVQAYGNLVAAVALLHGMAVEDLTTKELEYNDDDYQITIVARVVKPTSADSV